MYIFILHYEFIWETECIFRIVPKPYFYLILDASFLALPIASLFGLSWLL